MRLLVVPCSQVFRPFKLAERGLWGSRFMAVSRGGGDCADEVIGSNWPTENEDSYTAYATALLEKASQAQKAAQAKQSEQQYAQSETSSQTLDALAKAAGLDAAKHMQSAEDFAKAAGWAKYAATAIKAAKLAMNEAAAAHEAVHAMPAISPTAASKGGKGATQKAKDADLEEKQNLVADAKGSMDSALDAADRAVQADAIPTPFGGTPAIPEGSGTSGTDAGGSATGLPGDAPVASVPGGAGAPSAIAGGGGEAPAAPAAPALPPSVFAAPAAPPAGLGGDPASALGSSPAAASAGEGAGSGMSSGMGGMPMGGSPMGMGQMPMQPPQMPQGGAGTGGGPVGEVAKPVSDMVSKLAGKDGGPGAGGVPVSEQTLDKLLASQGGDSGAGGDQQAPSDDGSGDGKPGDGKGDHLDGDPKKGVAAGSHDQVTGVRAPTDPYSASNTNPALNNPAAAHGGAPSPAAPVVTAPPVAVSAPMTELSADDNAPAAPVQHAAAQVQPPTVENAGLHTHTAAAGITGPGAPAPASPNPQAQGGLLGAYPTPGGMPAPTPPMGGMPMMPPMSGMGGAAGGGGGSVSPVLAAVPAAIGAAVVARDSHREPQGDAPIERILALPPEHATAENHLAGLVKAFRTHKWESERIAVGVFMSGTVLQPRLRYLIATSDALSLIPLYVAAPAGVELLSQQRVRSSFISDWSGNDHPGRKLAAFANQYSHDVGRLVYLVSTDPDAVQSPGRCGEVIEAYQNHDEQMGLIRDNRATAAVAPRTEIARNLPIRAEQAEAALAAFGAAWGFHDATSEDFRTAPAMLWATRWGRTRSRPDDWAAILSTYLYVEGLEALRVGRPDEAAYSASAMLAVDDEA